MLFIEQMLKLQGVRGDSDCWRHRYKASIVLSANKGRPGVVKQANSPSLSCTAIQPFVPSTLIDVGTTVVNSQVREC